MTDLNCHFSSRNRQDSNLRTFRGRLGWYIRFELIYSHYYIIFNFLVFYSLNSLLSLATWLRLHIISTLCFCLDLCHFSLLIPQSMFLFYVDRYHVRIWTLLLLDNEYPFQRIAVPPCFQLRWSDMINC